MNAHCRVGRILVIAVAVAGIGCAADPPITRLTFATDDPTAAPARVLRQRVEGKACFTRSFVRSIVTPPWLAQRADHGQAIATAIGAVEGANVLLDASLRVEIQQYLLFSRICAIARGSAGVLE